MSQKKHNEKEYILKLIQDMRVRARDMEDFNQERKYKRIIKKLESGFEEEYKRSGFF